VLDEKNYLRVDNGKITKMAEEPQFDAPIPGQSLTAEVGSRPWQNPPKYATVDEALEHYIPRITSPKMSNELLDIMEMGVPITSLADTIQSGGLMQGLHTVDVGILILPVLMEMLAYIAEDADIEYDLGMEARVDEDKIPESKIALAMSKMRKEMPEAMNSEQENVVVEEPVEEAPEEEVVAPPAGLMSRRM
tara:strand:- start:914 stop:1489 length:576 start_codon:yes stop_codon:yes gene_type:complete